MPKLLVIDDNRSVRESLRLLFQRHGYDVAVAESGAQALALAAAQPFDFAMVDVNMPGMNGIEVCRKLREQAAAAGHEISVWMMTGARTPEVVRLAGEAGAVTVFGKPFDFRDLVRRLDQHFAGRPAAAAAKVSRTP